jgi:hypothetical protein
LQAVCVCQTPQLVRDTKLLFFCAGCLRSVEKEPHFLPWEFHINPRVTLVEKTSLATSLCAWSSNKSHLKSRIAAISMGTHRMMNAAESHATSKFLNKKLL